VTVRRAGTGDIDEVRGVRLQALADAPEAFDTTLSEAQEFGSEDWRRWIAEGATFLLESSGSPAGIAVSARHASDASARVLASVWVSPGLRGTGAATRLVAAALSSARSEGAERVVLHVGRENLRARRFYLRRGFCFTGAEVARVRDGLVELEMMLELG